MRKVLIILSILLTGICLGPGATVAQEVSNAELLRELKALREKVRFLENRVQELEGKSQGETMVTQEKPGAGHYHSVRGLSDRVRRIEQVIEQKPFLPDWAKRFHLSGLLEVEANYEKMDYKDSAAEDTDSSDIVLATAELDVDVDIAKYVQGHIAFLWEEDDTEPVDIDEAFIILDGGEALPLYLNAGKLYVPFGYFESHFISDPLTLEIGETNQSAVKVGFAGGWIDICAAVFNGDVDETGSDNHINNFVGSLKVEAPEDLFPGLNITSGVSYIRNIGDSDGLQEELPDTIRDYVGGVAAFLSLGFKDRYFLELEYVGALDRFEAGELSFDQGKRAEPEAWNMEFACRPLDRLEVAIRYEGSNDLGEFLPETQFGLAVIYDLFDGTSFSVEYLRGEFENDDQRDLLTGQLSVQF